MSENAFLKIFLQTVLKFWNSKLVGINKGSLEIKPTVPLSWSDFTLFWFFLPSYRLVSTRLDSSHISHEKLLKINFYLLIEIDKGPPFYAEDTKKKKYFLVKIFLLKRNCSFSWLMRMNWLEKIQLERPLY